MDIEIKTPNYKIIDLISPNKFNEIGSLNLETLKSGVDHAAVAILGLKNFINTQRLETAELKNKKLEDQQRIRPDILNSIVQGTAFNSGSEPVTRSERRMAMRNARRRNTLVRNYTRKVRLNTYGGTDSEGRALYTDDPEKVTTKDGRPVYVIENGDVVVKRATRSAGDTHSQPFSIKNTGIHRNIENPAPRPSDLGTPAQIERLNNGRYTKSRVKSELKTARKFNRINSGVKHNPFSQASNKVNSRVNSEFNQTDIKGKLFNFRKKKVENIIKKRLAKSKDLSERIDSKRKIIEDNRIARKQSK